MVHDRKNGVVWGPRGERSTLPRSGSGQRATLHCSISTRGRVVVGEYARADSYTFADHAGKLLEHDDKVVVFTDNHSSHVSKDFKRAMRRLRRMYPGKRMRVRTLPVGSPYLNAVEEFWNTLKGDLLARYHYPDFDDMRWEISDFAEKTRTVGLDVKEYLFRDPSLYAVG